MKARIYSIKAREIIDSRGTPTVEATVTLCGGYRGTASSPSGASTGIFEALELRDKEKRYFGKGVLRAVENINKIIAPKLVGSKGATVRYIDKKLISLDGTENKSRLGANATLAVSLALAKANAKELGVPLYKYIGGICAEKMPIPMMNILNGGAHATNNLDIQEFMIVPFGFDEFSQALRAGCEIYNELKKILKGRGLSTSVGDEGGFAPDLESHEQAIELIVEAINGAGYDTDRVKIALDIAASEWWEGDGKYMLPKQKKEYTTAELIDKWSSLISKYPILSIEDPLGEEDYDGWTEITSLLGKRVMLVGDDLFVTNSKRLKMGFDKKMGNSILIKPNQIGTLTETLEVIYMAKSKGYNTIISHRSGETDDTYIADIAVGTNAGFIKTGAPCRMDRVSKYNRLLRIEEEIYRNVK
ncbi:MAG: phosphopyruvate hydratase [Clostridia bacterium]|nr:phosphopyruvate hydratase [Clostridia bacterium]